MSNILTSLAEQMNIRKEYRQLRRKKLTHLREFLFKGNLGIGFHQKYLFEGEVLSNIPVLPSQNLSISQKYITFGWGVVSRENNLKNERRWCIYVQHSRKWGGKLVPIMEAGEWYQEQFIQRCETFLTGLSAHLEKENTLTKVGLDYLDGVL